TLDRNQEIDNQINLHFADRLFDRDTLIVQSYSINFLYVLWSYISSNNVDGNQFKVAAKGTFRESLVAFIEANYNFSLVTTDDPVSDFIKENFYKLNGRIYRPANFADNNNFIIALRDGQNTTHYLNAITDDPFTITEYKLS